MFERSNTVEAARKLNVIQPVSLPPEGGSHTFESPTSDGDGPAATKPRSGDVGPAATKPRPIRHSAERDGGSGEVGHNLAPPVPIAVPA
jgi:hypothetical protein